MTTIYHNLNESVFSFNYKNFTFYFSSFLYYEKFLIKYRDYVKNENDKFIARFRNIIDAEEILLLELYRKIEKRGFRVYYNNMEIKEISYFNFNINSDKSYKYKEI